MGKHFSILPSLAVDPDVTDLPLSSSHLLHPSFPHTCPVNNRNHSQPDSVSTPAMAATMLPEAT